MFGVLVVAAPDGRVGYLCGFSGMLDERWHVDGFAPPLFDPVARDAFWPAGQAELYALAARHAELVDGAEAVALRTRLAELTERQAAATAELRARHEENRRLRQAARRRLTEGTLGEEERRAALHALGQESRADSEARRRQDAAHHQERESLAEAQRELTARRTELERLRAGLSRQLWRQIAASYVIPNARGETRTLEVMFAPEPPPGGAGDCAAPKLLAQAYHHRLKPLALAEFWWGAPPLTGDRHAGEYYPACQSKCGAVLPYMLEGLSVDPAPASAATPGPEDELRVVYEDAWLLVVDKPCGLLSVPGRHEPRRDSVLVRLQSRSAAHSGPLILHPLEAETSGLLLVAKDLETHAALHQQFGRSEADKRYVAWLDGHVTGDQGLIELPLRADPEQRPRHLVDPLHGKRALTEWHVLRRTDARTRVSLIPRTDRTHQLRVHTAHPLGLGAPLVGDRLYGRDDARLLLHAEAVTFTHPRSGERIHLESPPPF
ncbi:RluA family pseudouridine synthase [Hyalangium gracile]|uniref:RluA family pseudouridine synthase n=1 Tax=Hyalangium gracile TaxID=394092 RepID=UPI001CCDDABC